MNSKTRIQTLEEQVRIQERNVEAQRWRVSALDGNEDAVWLAKQLLAASEETLRAHRKRLAMLTA